MREEREEDMVREKMKSIDEMIEEGVKKVEVK